jgi:DNA-binding transcriptional ArsR family regulator
MSRHLRVLRTTGLVEEAHGAEALDARVRVYRLRPEPFDALRAWIVEVESYWALELAAFKRHAERAGRRKKKTR